MINTTNKTFDDASTSVINEVKGSENEGYHNKRMITVKMFNDNESTDSLYGPGIVKGPWTKEEDRKLVALVDKYSPRNWSFIAKKMGSRLGKQCRERWHNHLNPNITKKPFSAEEDLLIVDLHNKYGNKWSEIAKHLPGRTDNAIKNYWNSTIQRRTQKTKRNSMFSSIEDFQKTFLRFERPPAFSQNYLLPPVTKQTCQKEKVTRSLSVTFDTNYKKEVSEEDMDELDEIASTALLKIRSIF